MTDNPELDGVLHALCERLSKLPAQMRTICPLERARLIAQANPGVMAAELAKLDRRRAGR